MMNRMVSTTKVHPNSATVAPAVRAAPPFRKEEEVLTIWRKSLLLNCSGFTVFDNKGNLVFRVDNYVSGNKAEVLLMDAAGKPLLTVRRKRLSFGDNWQVFTGETAVSPRFTARKPRQSKCIAQVSRGQAGDGGESPPSASRRGGGSSGRSVAYEIEGSYAQRSCIVYDERRRQVAEIRRKEAVGSDVFRLVVQPEMDTAEAMALVILLDQMFGSSRR